MIQKKICLLGAFSVGKTSLIQQFVSSLFDDKYLTTVGVKVDKKIIPRGTEEVMLIIWDLAGEDDYSNLNTKYLRGAAGYILVVDGTRPKSLDVALSIHQQAIETLGSVPYIIAINKADLEHEWVLTEAEFANLNDNHPTIKTSAKSGNNVEALFSQIAHNMQ